MMETFVIAAIASIVNLAIEYWLGETTKVQSNSVIKLVGVGIKKGLSKLK